MEFAGGSCARCSPEEAAPSMVGRRSTWSRQRGHDVVDACRKGSAAGACELDVRGATHEPMGGHRAPRAVVRRATPFDRGGPGGRGNPAPPRLRVTSSERRALPSGTDDGSRTLSHPAGPDNSRETLYGTSRGAYVALRIGSRRLAWQAAIWNYLEDGGTERRITATQDTVDSICSGDNKCKSHRVESLLPRGGGGCSFTHAAQRRRGRSLT